MRNDFYSNYLEHSAKGTSWTKKDHKWVKRIKKNGKWVYYYQTGIKDYYDQYAKKEGYQGIDWVSTLKKRSKRASEEYEKYKQEAEQHKSQGRYEQQRKADYEAYKAYREAERKGRDAAYYEHDKKINEYKVNKAIEKGRKFINKLFKKKK